MEKITILANRLAESILMDWDKEEQIKLAKEVAVECHSIIHDKKRPRDVMSDLCLVRALHLKCLSCVLMLDIGEENVAIE